MELGTSLNKCYVTEDLFQRFAHVAFGQVVWQTVKNKRISKSFFLWQ